MYKLQKLQVTEQFKTSNKETFIKSNEQALFSNSVTLNKPIRAYTNEKNKRT
jgi:hypothetical protein